MTATHTLPTEAELVQRAQDMIPSLREKAHAHDQGVFLRMPVGKTPHQGLQNGRRDLVRQCQQANLRETELVAAFEQRVQSQNQRLQHVVQKMGAADGAQYAVACAVNDRSDL